MGKINSGLFTSNTDMWSTPQTTFDALNREFHFDLDVCATPENAKCAKYFTKEQDGLSQYWGANICWMNPPYGREIGKWVRKAHDTAAYSMAPVVALLPARTDTKWFHEYIYGKGAGGGIEIRFIKGRLKFGDAKNSAPFPSMIVIWRGPRR